MPSRHLDWMRQAVRDLAHAHHALQAGDHEWACFAAQQAAEKAVKSVLMARGAEAWGHSVLFLLRALREGEGPSEELVDRARELDKLYVPARYPNGFDTGAPMDYFTPADASRSIGCAQEIIDYCQGRLRQ